MSSFKNDVETTEDFDLWKLRGDLLFQPGASRLPVIANHHRQWEADGLLYG